MKYIVGLGNPGPEHRKTKHNIGFDVVESLAKDNGIRLNKSMHFSLVGKGRIAGEEVFLALPQTYMNLSGNAVGEIFRREIKDLKDLVVVCDDINIELGRIRLRTGGSSGGQKGLGSVINVLGRDDFARLRVGIATGVHRGDITNYVLSPFKRKDARNVLHAVGLAKDALTCLVEDGIEEAMAKFNKRKTGNS